MLTIVSFDCQNVSLSKYKCQDKKISNIVSTPSSLKGSRKGLIVKVHLAEVDLRPDLGDAVLHLRDGVHQQVMAAPV